MNTQWTSWSTVSRYYLLLIYYTTLFVCLFGTGGRHRHSSQHHDANIDWDDTQRRSEEKPKSSGRDQQLDRPLQRRGGKLRGHGTNLRSHVIAMLSSRDVHELSLTDLMDVRWRRIVMWLDKLSERPKRVNKLYYKVKYFSLNVSCFF